MPESDNQLPAGTPAPRAVTARKMYLTVISVSLVMGFFASFATVNIYDRYYATKILEYDLPSKLRLVETSVAEGKITLQQAEQVSLLEISDAKKIADSVPPNYIVVTGGVVLGNHARTIGQ